jgi:hypothetical protein
MFHNDEEPESSLVYLYYESAGEMAFKTGPKFGCVHHPQADHKTITKPFPRKGKT